MLNMHSNHGLIEEAFVFKKTSTKLLIKKGVYYGFKFFKCIVPHAS